MCSFLRFRKVLETQSKGVIKIANLSLSVILSVVTIMSCSQGATHTSQLETIEARGVIVAGIRSDNPPHSYIDNGQLVGFDVDIASGIAKELGVGLEIVRVDELTRISYLVNGKIDIAVASLSHTKARDEVIDFSETYFWSYQTFLVVKDKVRMLSELLDQPVGFNRGSHSQSNWQNWLINRGFPASTTIVEFDSKHVAAEAVRKGLIAGWAEDVEVLSSYAREYPGLAVLYGQSIGIKQDAIGLPENDSDFRDAINFALQRLVESGRYNEIYSKWFGPNSATPIPQLHSIEVWPDG
jgi:polar amino acid transport system substrate-binding protein